MKIMALISLGSLLVFSQLHADDLIGKWAESADGQTRCYPKDSEAGARPISSGFCGTLVGKLKQSVSGETFCYREGASPGAQPISHVFCRN